MNATGWHVPRAQDVLRQLNTTEAGLSSEEVAIRLQQYGPNRLPERPPPTLLEIFLRQFRSPLIYVLGFAALFSAFIGEYKDTTFILGVLLINAIIGTYHESRAEASSRALQKLMRVQAAAVRDGEVAEVDADDLVPGDIVWLESGSRIPADIRLLSARGMEVDESLLTGESLAVRKNPAWPGEERTPLADRQNMLYAGALIAHGHGTGVVVATGMHSAVGRVAADVMRADAGKPPLIERMETFTRRIGLAVIAAAAIVGVIGVAVRGFGITEMVMFAIAMAVSAIPEGLPVALTVALAVASHRMARRRVIVRRLAAVEGLGSCTLIASDKTGTLTVNELTVKELRTPDGRVFQVTGQGFVPHGRVLVDDTPVDLVDEPGLERLARAVVLCNESDLHRHDHGWTWHGDSVDIALLSFAHKLNWRRETALERHPEINSIPFEPERQYAASYHQANDGLLVFVKGAPERLASMCADADAAVRMLKTAEGMAADGFRVLAVAEGRALPDLDPAEAPPEPAQLELLGLVGMIDPLRSGVREAVAQARAAGVSTIMVTGDHPVTALAIARELGLATSEDEVLTGAEILDQAAEALAGDIRRVRVFARVTPHQKLQIVNAARAVGHFVAVTGDGVNDAPALKAANIGVAMGRAGTDVAREASELIITDDHYATITAGIEEGRIAYDNIRKVIYLLVSTGAAEVVLLGLAVALGTPLPLLPVQLLWLNLVTNGIQDVALAFEPGEPGVRKRQPRPPRESIFNRLMLERTVVGAAVMGVVAFFLFQWMLDNGFSIESARNHLLLLMVLFENVHIFNCRSELTSAFLISPLRSPVLMGGAVIAFLVHVSMLYLPVGQSFLGTVPVGAGMWGVLILSALSILLVMELHKLYWHFLIERR